MTRLRNIDWRTVLLVFAACYALPWVIVQTALYLLFPEAKPAEFFHIRVAALLGGLVALTGPICAGYFAAKRARQQPWLSAMFAVLLGVGASMVIFDYTLGSRLVQAAISLTMGALGALMFTRSARREA